MSEPDDTSDGIDRRLKKGAEERSKPAEEVCSEELNEGVFVIVEKSPTDTVQAIVPEPVGAPDMDHSARMEPSVDMVNLDPGSAGLASTESMEAEDIPVAAVTVSTLLVAAPRRCSKRPNAGQHSNLYHEPRSVSSTLTPAAVSQILAELSSVLFREAVKEVKNTLSVAE
ncbi:hypothetical protein Q7C36_008130 [Tachysurus vachellii]|uniref:Uncharacterized protein n=1 Tax=Tachysurus vachellii TaxID=175792 RepID=A0AA88SWD2_TACVA|nr:hypothetical protein Q7C36_008130 [Tachysurus vachellii]